MSTRLPEEKCGWPGDSVARVRVAHLEKERKRRPLSGRADEAGAVWVVDEFGGTRAVYLPEPASKEWLRVVALPAPEVRR